MRHAIQLLISFIGGGGGAGGLPVATQAGGGGGRWIDLPAITGGRQRSTPGARRQRSVLSL